MSLTAMLSAFLVISAITPQQAETASTASTASNVHMFDLKHLEGSQTAPSAAQTPEIIVESRASYKPVPLSTMDHETLAYIARGSTSSCTVLLNIAFRCVRPTKVVSITSGDGISWDVP